MDDINIIKLFESRSEEALSETDKKYGAYCFACAKNILGSDEDAKECLNDTYLCLWNSIPPQKPENLRAFAAKICRNLALNMFRKKNTEKRMTQKEAALEAVRKIGLNQICAVSDEWFTGHDQWREMFSERLEILY